jgi:hypothetical protein
MTDIIDELLVVADLLDEAKKYGLEAEVVYFALKYMKKNSDLSIIEAITYGYDEWVK